MNNEIVIVGTAHVSGKSIAEVDSVIAREKPDIVAVELCPRRYRALKGAPPTQLSIKDLLKGEGPYLFLAQWLLAWTQKKIGADIGIKPGAEMLAAINKAEEVGAKIALVDRDIQVTLQRFWSRMGVVEKLKMLLAFISTFLGSGKEEIDIETITDEDVVTRLISELRQFSPGAAKTLVDERDAYIAGNLLNLAKKGKVVAVIGAGHREGVQKFLSQPEVIPPLGELVRLPRKRINMAKVFGIATIALIATIFALLALSGASTHTLLLALGYWFVINGVLSGAGAALARGHPFSILTAFSVAWLTSLNPFLAAGWFAGLVEAWVRKPTGEDLVALTNIETFGELMKNRLFRVILVAALANIGSIIGTFVGAWFVFNLTGIRL
ncbi:MAG: TraB/GumN family protein [Methanocellales archaeon]|nr:TraB/GumN family protein [Methanocellales archaeon]